MIGRDGTMSHPGAESQGWDKFLGSIDKQPDRQRGLGPPGPNQLQVIKTDEHTPDHPMILRTFRITGVPLSMHADPPL